MIIHHPEKIVQENHTILWSKIDLDAQIERFPEYVWYRAPNRYAEYLCDHSDAFLIPALMAAMYFGEDIRVRGAVSPRLAYHLDEYQFILNYQFPQNVRPVSIEYECLEALAVQPTAVGTTFSGGVDSFFALFKHAPDNQPSPDYRITYALFVNGFDIVRKEEHRYRTLYERFQQALGSINVELVPLETNVMRLIVPWLSFARFYPPALIGSALSLAGLFKRFIISNSWDYYQLEKYYHGSNPLSDRLLSTETLDVEHFGANYRRVEKVEAIREWKLAQDHLRVCQQPDLGDQELNCSRCGKCIRTMIPIYALGEMEQFHTFPRPLRSNRDVLRWARKFDASPVYAPEIYPFLRKHKPGMLPWLRLAVFLGYLRRWAIMLLPVSLKRYLQRFGHFTDHIQEEGAFENPAVIAVIHDSDRKKELE